MSGAGRGGGSCPISWRRFGAAGSGGSERPEQVWGLRGSFRARARRSPRGSGLHQPPAGRLGAGPSPGCPRAPLAKGGCGPALPCPALPCPALGRPVSRRGGESCAGPGPRQPAVPAPAAGLGSGAGLGWERLRGGR